MNPSIQRKKKCLFYTVCKGFGASSSGTSGYLELAEEEETRNDNYYGYISYHKAKGYHKLAVIEDDTGKKAVYLQQAKKDYDIADSQKDFPEPIQLEIQHAKEM